MGFAEEIDLFLRSVPRLPGALKFVNPPTKLTLQQIVDHDCGHVFRGAAHPVAQSAHLTG